MRPIIVLMIVSVAIGCTAQPTLTPAFVVPGASGQLIVVTTDSWDATSGTIQRFERMDADWQPVSDLVSVVVGRNGLGWGLGLHGHLNDGPVKREGDGRAPAGAFSLTQAFGYAESLATGLPYIHATREVECVDDSNSLFYNRVLDRSGIEIDWTSHEEMRRRDELYRVGVEVAHNQGAVPQGGSCIFLHIWRGPGTTTSGCTAMASTDMESIAEWLDASKNPILVQLPKAEYERLRLTWLLP